MRSIPIALFSAAFCGAVATAALAGEEPVQLKRAAGVDKVETNCAICHSLDYIEMNSPFLNAAGWDAEVAKMIAAFGAPISPGDAKIIGDYLKANYGQ
jgi:sulfite dehydrogenase (cytochrome) subunit B